MCVYNYCIVWYNGNWNTSYIYFFLHWFISAVIGFILPYNVQIHCSLINFEIFKSRLSILSRHRLSLFPVIAMNTPSFSQKPASVNRWGMWIGNEWVQRGQDHTSVTCWFKSTLILLHDKNKLKAERETTRTPSGLFTSHFACNRKNYTPYLRRVCRQYRDVFLRDIYVEFTWWLLWWDFDLAADEDFGERTEWIKSTSESTSRARRKAISK